MLPEPTAELQHQSSLLSQSIRQLVARQDGWVGFDQFMDHALYTPGLGYYSSGLRKFGEGGDFITAPMIGDLMARCLAVQCAEVLDALGHGQVIEFGSGTGQLAADLLSALRGLGKLPDKYLIVEPSADLKARQHQVIADNCGQLIERVCWLDQMPEQGFEGIVIANEVLDAMPAIRFEVDLGGSAEVLGVGADDGGFHWLCGNQPLPDNLKQRLDSLVSEPGYRGEVCLQAEAWVRTMGERMKAGVILLVDYGFPRHEFYHPERRQGTLMCHYRHIAHDDPFFYPGLQDITVHIDFTAIAQAADEVGMKLSGFTTQGAFLLSLGVLDMLAADQSQRGASPQQLLAATQQIRKLTMPHEMGELFKVIALSRNYPHALAGFSLKDHRGRL